MKRGLIQWDRAALPHAAFDARLARARKALEDRDLPALVVYSDVWRSNQGRYLTNFMPYWNRSLVVVPRESSPVLLCALSPRVYPWIRSVTVFEEIRPASKLVETLTTLCTERNWSRIGVLDLGHVIQEVVDPLRRSGLELVEVPSSDALEVDEGEIVMRRKAVRLAREVLASQLSQGGGCVDHQFVGGLEREFRRAGAEDLVVLLSGGESVPAPAKGAILGGTYSVAIALEYCGHWVKVTRAQCAGDVQDGLRAAFRAAMADPAGARVEDLGGAYPFVDSRGGSISAIHVEVNHEGRRLFYGDTCLGDQLL